MTIQSNCPPADRIRLGDTWIDLQGRLHRAEPCSTAGLVTMVPLNDPLTPPVAMSAAVPAPWRRIKWGGQ